MRPSGLVVISLLGIVGLMIGCGGGGGGGSSAPQGTTGGTTGTTTGSTTGTTTGTTTGSTTGSTTGGTGGSTIPAGYTVTDLGALPSGGMQSSANAINAAGQITGTSGHAFLWSSGTMTDLGSLSTGIGNYSEGFAINTSGQVVGVGTTGSGNLDAALFQNGTVTDLYPTYNGEDVARGINDSGTIILQDGSVLQNGQRTILRTGSELLTPYGINASGVICGQTTQAAIWQSGTITALPDLPGSTGRSIAYAINSAGTVCGSSGNSRAVSWQGGSVTDLGTPPGTNSVANAINDHGLIVGNSYLAGPVRALIWQGTTMVDLNTLVPPSSGWVLQQATGINNNGWICGNGMLGTNSRAFLLIPHA